MLFAPYERFHYARSPLVEVICQLRFPTILSIGANEPAAFQEAIRKDFPKYMTRQEQLPPKVVKKGNATALEPQKPITNYHFISEDGRWKFVIAENGLERDRTTEEGRGVHCDEIAETQGGFFMDPAKRQLVADRLPKYKNIQFPGIE